MSHADKSLVINRPVNEVYEFVLDGANSPKWRPSVTDVQLLTARPLGVGTRYKQGLKGPSGRIDGDYEIVESRPNEWIKFQVTAGPARPTGTYHFEPTDGGGTRVTFALDYEPKGFAKLMGPMITRSMWGEVANLDNLKAFLEGNR